MKPELTEAEVALYRQLTDPSTCAKRGVCNLPRPTPERHRCLAPIELDGYELWAKELVLQLRTAPTTRKAMAVFKTRESLLPCVVEMIYGLAALQVAKDELAAADRDRKTELTDSKRRYKDLMASVKACIGGVHH